MTIIGIPSQQARQVVELLDATSTRPGKNLATAIAAWQAARAELPDTVDVYAECLTVTADGVDNLIRRVTEQAVIRDNVLKSEAFALVAELLDRRVAATFTAGPEPTKVIARLAEMFTADAAVLVDALTRLPGDLTLTSTANGSPESLAAWAIARDASAALDQHRRHRTLLADWGIYTVPGIDSRFDQASRYATFTDPAAVDEILLPSRRKGPLGAWPSIARIPGVELRWNTPDEQVALAQHFADLDTARAREAAADAADAAAEEVSALVEGRIPIRR